MNDRKPDVVTVLVSRVDGGVTVLRIITAEYEPDGRGGRRRRWSVEPTAEYIDAIIAKHNWRGDLAPASWTLAANDVVNDQTDRTFRDAWKRNRAGIEVDMPRARNIQRDRLRDQRAPLFAELDAAYMKADERGDQQEKKSIAAQRQRLRDITEDPRIESAQTPDELRAVTLP